MLGVPAVNSLAEVTADQVGRVTTVVPFPRGLVMHEGKLYVLARGRVRDAGGVDVSLDDRAGTIFEVDPDLFEPITSPTISDAVATNGVVFAEPTSPPFRLLDRTLAKAVDDRMTDRPYCALRYDPASRNFFICAFSGIDKAYGSGRSFSKNLSDGLLRFDLRDRAWREVERHDHEAGGSYPHADPAHTPPPHGWLNGPDNCLVVGDWLYAVAKDNSLLVRYDLTEIRRRADAPAPRGQWTLGTEAWLADGTKLDLAGHSMLAYADGHLYLGTRTSSHIVRFRVADDGTPILPIVVELVARFDAYDATTKTSADLTDMSIGPNGFVYVISAKPSRVFRFKPDPANVFDARGGREKPWADLASLTANPKMKSENVLVDDAGRVFVTAGDAYAPDAKLAGTVYVIRPAGAN